MTENYILRFKCKGKSPFTLTCDDPCQITTLIHQYCLNPGDSCAMESPIDREPGITVAIKTDAGDFVLETSIEQWIVDEIRSQFTGES